MKIHFDEKRATQAAAILLKEAGGRMNYMKLLKLLYLADRTSLVEKGRTIAGASFYIMKHGPLAGDVLNCIKKRSGHGDFWACHIHKEGYDVAYVTDPGDGELSDYDVEVLTELQLQHTKRDAWDMVRFVRALPEWHPLEGREALSLEEILRKAGVNEEDVKTFAEQMKHLSALDRYLAEIAADTIDFSDTVPPDLAVGSVYA